MEKNDSEASNNEDKALDTISANQAVEMINKKPSKNDAEKALEDRHNKKIIILFAIICFLLAFSVTAMACTIVFLFKFSSDCQWTESEIWSIVISSLFFFLSLTGLIIVSCQLPRVTSEIYYDETDGLSYRIK
jgi:hypothetical protein